MLSSFRLPFFSSLLLLVILSFLTVPLAAQPATGAIAGRVVHATTGRYLVNVRVTVEGTALETFTDALGAYRLAEIPAGSVTLIAFFTGLTPSRTTIIVAAGQTATRDVTLDSLRLAPTSPTTPSANAPSATEAGSRGGLPSPIGQSVPQWIGIATFACKRRAASAARSGSRWPGPRPGPQPVMGRQA